MKKMLLITVFTLLSLLNAACLGDNPGEVYFNAYTKDGSGNYTVPALYKTTDYGQTAKLVADNFEAEIYKDKAKNVFYRKDLYNGQGFYYSADSMQTWTLRWPQYNSIKTGVTEGVIFGGASYFSADYGASWTTTSHNGLPLIGTYSWSLGLDPGEVYIYMYNQKLYRSTDYGDNFTMINDTLNLGDGGLGRGWVAGELFLGKTSNRKIYRSFDYGQTFAYSYTSVNFWNNIRSGQKIYGFVPDEIIAYTISRSPSMIYNDMEIKFYHSYDLYQTVDSVTTNYNVGIDDNKSQLPSYKLSNYPNPFNNTTVINYQLLKDNTVEIAVYNAKGELVRSLFNGKQTTGSHVINFNADGLNSGVYYIKLSGKNITRTTKCLLVK